MEEAFVVTRMLFEDFRGTAALFGRGGMEAELVARGILGGTSAKVRLTYKSPTLHPILTNLLDLGRVPQFFNIAVARCININKSVPLHPFFFRIYCMCKIRLCSITMNLSLDQIWKHYGVSSKNRLPDQTKCWCLHCGISVKPEKAALLEHLQHCQTFLDNNGYSTVQPSESAKTPDQREHDIQNHIDGTTGDSVPKLDFTSHFRMGIIGIGCDPDTILMYASACESCAFCPYK